MSLSGNRCQQDRLVVRCESLSDSKSRKSFHSISSRRSFHSSDQEKKEHYLHILPQEKAAQRQEPQQLPVEWHINMKQESQPKHINMKQESQPNPSKIQKQPKKKAESLKKQRQSHNYIDHETKIRNKMMPKGIPASPDLDSFIEQAYSYELQSKLNDARFQFESKISHFEDQKNDISESIRAKSQNQRSKLFDIKLAYKKMAVAFNDLNDLQTRMLKIKQKDLSNHERRLKKL